MPQQRLRIILKYKQGYLENHALLPPPLLVLGPVPDVAMEEVNTRLFRLSKGLSQAPLGLTTPSTRRSYILQDSLFFAGRSILD